MWERRRVPCGENKFEAFHLARSQYTSGGTKTAHKVVKVAGSRFLNFGLAQFLPPPKKILPVGNLLASLRYKLISCTSFFKKSKLSLFRTFL